MRRAVLPLASFASLASLALAACGPGPSASADGPTPPELFAQKPRVMWVAAHPDDESMGGNVLARACVRGGSVCHFFVFNRGRGGECNLVEGCLPDLGTVRHQELRRAARLYRSTLEHYDFYNAPLPVESFPSRQELAKKWMAEGDPVGLVARAVRRFRPHIVVTLDAYQGFTGHPEHQAAGRFALAGVRLAAEPASDNALMRGEAPHRVAHVLHVQNKYWLMSAVGDPYDPEPWQFALDDTETCDVDREGRELRCNDVRMAHTRVHRSQDSDMGALRAASRLWGMTYVRRLDPFSDEATRLIRGLTE